MEEKNIVDNRKYDKLVYGIVKKYSGSNAWWITYCEPIFEFEPSTGSRVNQMITTCKEELEGKKYIFKGYNGENVVVDDCIIYTLKNALEEEHGRTCLYKINNEFLGLMVSEYMQNYIKKDLLKRLETNNYEGQLLETLRSNKLFNNMSKEEIIMLLDELEKTDGEKEKYVTSRNGRAEFIKFYLYKIGGKNIMDALIEKYGLEKFACHILETNGLSGSAGYYWGRGVNKSDLTETMMVAIYAQLKRFDEKLAKGFGEIVQQIPYLTATDFINTFYKYIESYIGQNVEIEPVSQEQFLAGLFSVLKNNISDEEQIEMSNNMKENFINSINLDSRRNDYDEDDDYRYGYRHRY